MTEERAGFANEYRKYPWSFVTQPLRNGKPSSYVDRETLNVMTSSLLLAILGSIASLVVTTL